MKEIISWILPLVSVLLGGGVTYWSNVRQRQRSTEDDVFTTAIAAVAAASAAQEIKFGLNPQPLLTADEQRALEADRVRDGVNLCLDRLAEARGAIAHASAYDQSLTPYYKDADWIQLKPDDTIQALREAHARHRQNARPRLLRRRHER